MQWEGKKRLPSGFHFLSASYQQQHRLTSALSFSLHSQHQPPWPPQVCRQLSTTGLELPHQLRCAPAHPWQSHPRAPKFSTIPPLPCYFLQLLPLSDFSISFLLFQFLTHVEPISYVKSLLFEIRTVFWFFSLDLDWFSLRSPWRDKYTKIQKCKQVKIHNSVSNGAGKKPLQFDVFVNIN